MTSDQEINENGETIGKIVSIKQNLLDINYQGERYIYFDIPGNADISELTVTLHTYLGYSKNLALHTEPFISSHSVRVLKREDLRVQFYPEWSTKSDLLLSPSVPNTVYFKLMTSNLNEPIIFDKG